MAETLKQAIDRAREVRLLLHPDYTDLIATHRVKVSKTFARTIASAAPAEAKPSIHWLEDDVLELWPEAQAAR